MKVLAKLLLVFMVSVCMFTVMPSMQVEAASSTIDNINVDRNSINTDSLKTVIGKILGFLQVASGLAAVIMIAVTGFNYIISTPEVKKEMLSKMLPIVVGLILVFGAVSIAKFLLEIVVT